MNIVYEGQPYPFAIEDVSVKAGIAIEAHTGTTFTEWWASIMQGGSSMLAQQALGWVILTGADPGIPIADFDFKVVKLVVALHEAFAAEAEAEAEETADPTPAADAATSTGQPEANGSAAAASGVFSPASSGQA